MHWHWEGENLMGAGLYVDSYYEKYLWDVLMSFQTLTKRAQ